MNQEHSGNFHCRITSSDYHEQISNWNLSPFLIEFKTESATLAQSFIEILMSTAKSEESSNDPREETETEVVQRKRSVLQRFVTALFSSKTNESNLHDSPGDLQLVEVNADGTMEGPSGRERYCYDPNTKLPPISGTALREGLGRLSSSPPPHHPTFVS